MWTIEFARKLVTGSEFDIQFNDLKKSYPFGVAIFDNARYVIPMTQMFAS